MERQQLAQQLAAMEEENARLANSFGRGSRSRGLLAAIAAAATLRCCKPWG